MVYWIFLSNYFRSVLFCGILWPQFVILRPHRPQHVLVVYDFWLYLYIAWTACTYTQFRACLHQSITTFSHSRMNKDLKQEAAASGGGEINIAARDKSVDPFKGASWSITKPLGIRKKYRFPDNSLLVESFGSSGSYGSLNDEETFTKRLNPPDFVK